MRLLLDTHVLLWILIEPERIPAPSRELLERSDGEIAFSVACLWEVAVRNGMRRTLGMEPLDLRTRLLGAGLEEIPIRAEHTLALASLPRLHGDPFDRILLAQALIEDRQVLTADPLLLQYPHMPVRAL